MAAIRVLVTGAGSGVGQGIIKALRASSLDIRIVSSDISILNSGLFRSDESILLPKVESTGALSHIIESLRQHHIDVLMVGSEFDLTFFAQHKAEIEAAVDCFVAVSPLEAVEIADDKWRTAEFLREQNLPYAESFLPADRDAAIEHTRQWGFPLVLKTRSGTSNRHVHIIESADALARVYDSVPRPMLQRLIARPSSELDKEYTCSVFKCADGRLLGPFTSRRTLRAGNSWAIEVAPFEELRHLLLKIGEAFPTLGSLNVQLMMSEKGPVPFEFNARFSGTTAVRAHFGFNEAEFLIRNYFLKETLPEPEIRTGLAFRYLEEIFVDGHRLSELQWPLPRGEVRPWF